jgi:hypothetical protein
MEDRKKFKVKDKVYVKDWGKQYTNFFTWNNNIKESIWNWKSELPQYCGTEFFWKYIYEDNLTLKGTINKRKPKKLIDKIPEYKNFEYKIE